MINTLTGILLKKKKAPDVDPFVRKLILGEVSKVIPLPVQIASGPSYRFNLAGGSEASPNGPYYKLMEAPCRRATLTFA